MCLSLIACQASAFLGFSLHAYEITKGIILHSHLDELLFYPGENLPWRGGSFTIFMRTLSRILTKMLKEFCLDL